MKRGQVTGSWGSGSDLISQRRSSTTNFYVGDASANVRALVSSAQAITDSYLFKAFGEELLFTGSTNNFLRAFGMFGYQRDASSRLYVRARALDVVKGRWDSRDPIGMKGGPNLYRYIRNNPLTFADPRGLDDCLKLKDLPHDIAEAIAQCIEDSDKDEDKLKDCIKDALKDKACETAATWFVCKYQYGGKDPCDDPQATKYEVPCITCCSFKLSVCLMCAKTIVDHDKCYISLDPASFVKCQCKCESLESF